VPATNYVGGFVTDPSGRPSYEELEIILRAASLASSAGGRADWYMVAVTDPATQFRIGQHDTQGIPRANPYGTVMVLIFTENVLYSQYRTDDARAFNPRVGYVNVGILSAYLNIAAISLGYSTRMFMTMRDPWPDVGEPWPELQHFLDGTHYIVGATGNAYSAENMKFAQAIVIGTMDNTVEGGATVAQRPQNWSFWTP
jgi:nitroreductase